MLGLFYLRNDTFILIAYCDADISGCNSDWKSTICTCFLLGNSLVSWSCKKQHNVALSTTKAKCMAASVDVHKFCGWNTLCSNSHCIS